MTFIPFDNASVEFHEKYRRKMEKIVSSYSPNLDKPTDEIMLHMKFDVPMMGILVEYLFSTTLYQMKIINRMYNTLEKTPNGEEFDMIKQELEEQKKNAIDTLLPIKKLAQNLEESKNKKVDYIG